MISLRYSTLLTLTFFPTVSVAFGANVPEIPKPDSSAIEINEVGQATSDPLQRAIEGMKGARQRLGNRSTDNQTQQIQKQVVRELEMLIKMAEQPSSPPSPPSSPQSPQQKQNEKKREQHPAPREQQQKQTETPQQSDKSTGDDVRTGEGRDLEAILRRRSDLVKEVWGHLPPALRQELLNIPEEKLLPKYSDLIRRYFESLAEQTGRGSIRRSRLRNSDK